MIGVALPAALSSPDISENWNDAAELRNHRKQKSKEDRLAEMRATQAQRDSEIALSRVKAGCVPVVDRASLGDTRLAEGVEVFISSGNQRLGDGSFACTKSGDTAEIFDGKATQVKRVGANAADEYSGYFSKQPGAY